MLVGIGLGPGDSSLLTLQAVDYLRRSDVVYVPGEMAAKLVEGYCEPVMLEFPMTHDSDELESCWEQHAHTIAAHARDELVSFGAIGDPNFFSTFSHVKGVLSRCYPLIEVITVPGISSITAFASRANVEVGSSFGVSDGSKETVKIVLKATEPERVAEQLRVEGYTEFLLCERLFSERERITDELPERSDYFSILYARKVSL